MDKMHYQDLSDRLEAVESKLNPTSEEYVLKPLIPYMQGAAGLGILWKAVVFIGGAVILYMQIKASLAGSPTTPHIPDVLK